MAAYLRKKGAPEDSIAALIERFVEVGLLNDRAFASAWVSSRSSYRATSKRVLIQELRKKGIDPDLIEEAVGQLDADADLDKARMVAAKKARSLAGLDRAVAMRRLCGALSRRGFSFSVVNQVANEVMGERYSE